MKYLWLFLGLYLFLLEIKLVYIVFSKINFIVMYLDMKWNELCFIVICLIVWFLYVLIVWENIFMKIMYVVVVFIKNLELYICYINFFGMLYKLYINIIKLMICIFIFYLFNWYFLLFVMFVMLLLVV